jgi:diguanylate cyclase (GGDEF)-like protein
VRAVHRRWTIAAVLLAAALVAAAGWYIADTQGQSRQRLRNDLHRRAALTARLVGGAFVASLSPQQLRELYGGTPSEVRRALAADADPSTKRTIVLASDGHVIAASPPALARDPGLVARSADLRAALRGRVALSDAFHDPARGWQVEIATPLDTPMGRRVVAGSGPVRIVREFAEGFFATATAVPRAQGYLIDGNDRVLSQTGQQSTDVASVPPRLADALRTASSGSYGDRTFVSAAVPAARWRVVLSVPSADLYAPVNGGPRRVAWVLFAAFAAAVAALLAIGVAAARGARRLAATRERELAARQLAHERLHDDLTGLPNRALFEDRAEHAIAAARRGGSALGIVFVDVDDFKRINDSLGHATGDAVLREVAQRLSAAVRASDTVSRFGGDEFIALVEAPTEHDVLRGVTRMQERLQTSVTIGARTVPVTFSIGVAVYTADEPPQTASALLQDADAAMYRAKASGRGRIELFDAELQREALDRLDAEEALRRAIDEDELVVHYQPVVSLPAGDIDGVEALVRWQRDGRLIAPAEFIPIAEETGLITEVGAWVLRTAIADVGEWARDGLLPDGFRLAVNVSARQLADANLPATVAAALAGWPLAPGNLVLEITETAVMTDAARGREMLERLDALGVELGLDDFGVGHSSLGQLARSLPISMLKLDRSFVGGMSHRRDRGIVQAAASLARALDLRSIAEGIEHPEQASLLAEMGFQYAQGFHFGRPADATTTAERVAGARGSAVRVTPD